MKRRELSADAVAILKYLARAEKRAHGRQLKFWKSIGEPMSEAAISAQDNAKWSSLYGRYDAAFDLLRGARRVARRALPKKGRSR